jgi:hypothetical protein
MNGTAMERTEVEVTKAVATARVPEFVTVNDEVVAVRIAGEEFGFECDEPNIGESIIPMRALTGFRLSQIPKGLTIRPHEAAHFGLSSFADGSASVSVEVCERRKLWDGDVGLRVYMEALRQAIVERDGAAVPDLDDDGDYILLHYEIRITEDLQIQDAINRVEGIIGEIAERAEQLAQMRVMEKRRARPTAVLVEIGRVAVDSGQLLIVDPCRATDRPDPKRILMDEESRRNGKIWRPRGSGNPVPNNHDLADYEDMCQVTLGPNGGGQARKVSTGGEDRWKDGIAGVVSRTAYGDDLYPVFQVFHDDQMVGLYVELDGLYHGSSGDGIGPALLNARVKTL